MSGGVLGLYVDATSAECNEAYEAFSAACDEKKKPSLKIRLGLEREIFDYFTDP
jgi:hypothetical protein